MRTPRHVKGTSILTIALVLTAFACKKSETGQTDSAAGAAATATTPTDTTAASATATVEMTAVDVAMLPGGGQYLTDGNGRALYLFGKDKPDSSNCTDACAQAWPPFTAQGNPMAHSSTVDATKLATTRRPDGVTQVTYNRMPLYYFAKDSARGDIKGQDSKAFGAEWYLVQPSGEKQKAKK
jgi:predicted lipoprotein with Yx(FWY)xxD motif